MTSCLFRLIRDLLQSSNYPALLIPLACLKSRVAVRIHTHVWVTLKFFGLAACPEQSVETVQITWDAWLRIWNGPDDDR